MSAQRFAARPALDPKIERHNKKQRVERRKKSAARHAEVRQRRRTKGRSKSRIK